MSNASATYCMPSAARFCCTYSLLMLCNQHLVKSLYWLCEAPFAGHMRTTCDISIVQQRFSPRRLDCGEDESSDF